MHITLTGNLGSGKSTISRIMHDKYGYEIYSTGVVLRHLAEERGISVLEMNQIATKDPSFDHLIDDAVRKISVERQDDLFFDSRLAWHFAVNTFKVFLSVSINEAARRVFNDNRGNVESYSSQEDAKAQLLERAHTEDIRYKDIYGIEYFKTSNYNLLLDSTFSSPEILAGVIMSEKAHYEELLAAGHTPSGTRILLSPARLCGYTAGNSSDNNLICESSVKVGKKGDDFEVIEGMDEVRKAAEAGYEFISVSSVDDIA